MRKIGKPLQKAERHCGKQKGVAESRKPLKKVGKPLRKIGKLLRKIGKQARKIGFGARKIPIFPRDSLVSGNFGDSFSYAIRYHVCARIYFVELKYSQLKNKHHSNTPSTKGDWRRNLQWCVYQGRQVTRQSLLVPFFQQFLQYHLILSTSLSSPTCVKKMTVQWCSLFLFFQRGSKNSIHISRCSLIIVRVGFLLG